MKPRFTLIVVFLCVATVSLAAPGRAPDRVVVNLTENPATSFAVSWRTAPGVTQSTGEIAIAEAAVAYAQAQLERLQAGPREEEVAAAQAELEAYQSTLWGAYEQYDQVAVGATEAEIAAAEVQVAQALAKQKMFLDIHDWTMRCDIVIDEETGEEEEHCPRLGTLEENARYNLHSAEEALAAAQAYLDQLLAGPTDDQLGAANADVAAAAAQRDASQAQLDLLLAGSSIYDVGVAETAVTQAEANLAAVKADSATEQIDIAQAKVEQARIALDEALENLEKAELVAPFAGTVTTVYVSLGETASGPAVELVDFDSLELVLDVDEVDIGQIEPGQTATITLEAWPLQELAGVVSSIAPTASPGETVTYQVHLRLASSDTGLAVRPGMSATADIVTAYQEGVLLIPNLAVIADRQAGHFYVDLAQAGTVSRVEIEVGMHDAWYTEIVAGLEAGDQLVVAEEAALDLLNLNQGPARQLRELRP